MNIVLQMFAIKRTASVMIPLPVRQGTKKEKKLNPSDRIKR